MILFPLRVSAHPLYCIITKQALNGENKWLGQRQRHGALACFGFSRHALAFAQPLGHVTL